MSLRAIWIIPVNKDAEVPIFTRYFPSVEIRCRAHSSSYIKIPPEKEFVKSLLTEVGLKDGDIFVDTRDQCDKQVLYPTFQLQTENGSLWPVVVMESKGFIYCALPYEENNNYMNPTQCKVVLADVPSISMALEVLNGLAECVALSRSSGALTQGSQAMSELIQYVSISLPFGRPICCDAFVARQLLSATVKGKAKQPAWNPVPHKAKSQVILHIREEVRCMQFNHPEMQDVVDVYGTVICKADVEGSAPEISLVLAQSKGGTGSRGLVVSAAVSNIEIISQTSSQLRFRPSNSKSLCHYSLPNIVEPPIYGAFSMKIIDNIANLHVQLQLKNGVKNLFQQLEVQVPFPGFYISSLKPSCSLGSVSIHSKSVMVWNVGSKFPSKSLDTTLSAVVRLRDRSNMPTPPASSAVAEMGSGSGIRSADFGIGAVENVTNTFALLLFKIADYTYSGTKVDPQSVVVSTASKVRCSVSSEFVANVYKIWNSGGEVPIITDPLTEELRMVLKQGSGDHVDN